MSKDLYFNNDNLPPGVEDPAYENNTKKRRRKPVVLPEGWWPEGLFDDKKTEDKKD